MFRDGEHVIPDHVAAMLDQTEVETFRYTVKEAIAEADRRMVGDIFRREQERIIREVLS